MREWQALNWGRHVGREPLESVAEGGTVQVRSRGPSRRVQIGFKHDPDWPVQERVNPCACLRQPTSMTAGLI